MDLPLFVSSRERAQQYLSLAGAYRQDSAFRARADADPHAVLAEHGIDVPKWVDIRIVENTAETHHFVLPPNPNANLRDEDLAMVAGGKNSACICFGCCA